MSSPNSKQKIDWHWQRLRWLVVVVAVIAVDQLSKMLVLHTLTPGVPVVFIPGVLNWMLAFNQGAAFSVLASAGGWQTVFLIGIAVMVCATILLWLLRAEHLHWSMRFGITLIMGGAIGNVIDRFDYGHVVDFISWHYGTYYWPTFNVADSAICVGAAILIFGNLIAGKKK